MPILDLDWTHPEIGDRGHEVKAHAGDGLPGPRRPLRPRRAHAPGPPAGDRGGAEARRRRATRAEMRQNIQTQIAKRNELLAKAIPLWETRHQGAARPPLRARGLGQGLPDARQRRRRASTTARQYIMVVRASQYEKRKAQEGVGGAAGQAGHLGAARGLRAAKSRSARQRAEGPPPPRLRCTCAARSTRSRSRSTARSWRSTPPRPAALVERAQAQAKLGKFPLAVKDLEDYLKLTDPQRQRAARTRAAELLNTLPADVRHEPHPRPRPRARPRRRPGVPAEPAGVPR